MGSLIACTILSGRALSPLSQFPNMLAQAKKSKIAMMPSMKLWRFLLIGM